MIEAASAAAPAKGTSKGNEGQVLLVGDNIAVADTQYGKVRGYVLRGIHYFLGIPYGADTSGANRFMPPQKPKPWTDVRPGAVVGQHGAAEHGQPLRQPVRLVPRPLELRRRQRGLPAAQRLHARAQGRQEAAGDVLDPRRRLHATATRIEHDGYNGENLARLGDVVFCSINHRLGPLGYCNLAGVGGEKFAASGNVGMLDIVAALEWVRDNIANFGGDPGQRDDHGPVGRRRQGVHADRDAVGQGPVPQGGRAERRVAAHGRQGDRRRSSGATCSSEAGLDGRATSASCSRCRGSEYLRDRHARRSRS